MRISRLVVTLGLLSFIGATSVVGIGSVCRAASSAARSPVLNGSVTLQVTAPLLAATETITVGFVYNGVADQLQVNVGVSLSMDAQQKATAVATAIQSAASSSGQPLSGSSSGDTVTVAASSGATIGSISVSNNSHQDHVLTAPLASGNLVGALALDGAISGVQHGGLGNSVLTIVVGTDSHSFQLSQLSTFRDLLNAVRGTFLASSTGCTMGASASTLIFSVPVSTPHFEVRCNDRTLNVNTSVGAL